MMDKFTGKERDEETGLYYFCQRYYDPKIGRFITLDPLPGDLQFPQAQMPYGYCMNNPLKWIDPLGLQQEPPMWEPEWMVFPMPEVVVEAEAPLWMMLVREYRRQPHYWEAQYGAVGPAYVYRGPLGGYVGGIGELSRRPARIPTKPAPANHTAVDVQTDPSQPRPSLAQVGYSWTVGFFSHGVLNGGEWHGYSTSLLGVSFDIVFGRSGDVFREYGFGYGRHLGIGILYENTKWIGVALHVGLSYPPKMPGYIIYGKPGKRRWPW